MSKVFLTKWSEVSGGRFDPLYYNSVNSLSIVKKTVYTVSKLSEVINMQRGRFGHRPRNAPHLYNGEYPFIQTGDIVRSSETSEPISFSQTLNEAGLKTSRLFSEPVVVLTIAANIGDTAILDYPACFPDSLIGLTPKNNELTLNYINLYFKFIKNYLNDLAPQAAQKNINYQQLTSVPIIVPPINKQIVMTKLYEQALLVKEKAQTEAKRLLESIDDYLLQELGITLPKEESNDITQRVFTRKWSEVSGERLDAPSHKIGFSFINTKFKLFNLVEGVEIDPLTRFDDEQDVTFIPMEKISDEYAEADIDLSRSTHESKGYTKFLDNDLLWAKITPCMENGKSAVVKNLNNSMGFGSTEYFVFRAKELLNIDYLHALLRLKVLRNLATNYFTGTSGHQRVSSDFFRKLKIPLPALKKQNEIASHITAIRQKAKALQENALSDFEKAKADVEMMILGED